MAPVYTLQAQSKVAGTTLVLTTTQSIPAGSTIILGGGHDNTSASAPTVSINVPAGELAFWNINQGASSVTTSSGGGARGFIAWTKNSVDWPSGTVLTITYSASITARAAALATWAPGTFKRYEQTSQQNSSSSGAAQVTHSGVSTGDIIIGSSFRESATAPTTDTDTTNGSWAVAGSTIGTSGSTDATNMSESLQYKEATAGGSQTFNPGLSGDCGVVTVQFNPIVSNGKDCSLVVADKTAPSAGDVTLLDTLRDAGYNVTLVSDEDAVLPSQDLHVISESGSPTNLSTKYQNLSTPVLSFEVGGWDDQLWSGAGQNGNNAGSTTTADLQGALSIIAGLPDPITLFNSSGGEYAIDTATQSLASGAQVFAVHPTVSTAKVGFVFDAGASLQSGTANARQGALGVVDSRASALTADGRKLVVQFADYLTSGAVDVNVTDDPGSTVFMGGKQDGSAQVVADVIVADTPTGFLAFSGAGELAGVGTLDAPTGARLGGRGELVVSDVLLADSPSGSRIFSGVVEAVASDTLVSDTPTGTRLGGPSGELVGSVTLVPDVPNGLRLGGPSEAVIAAVIVTDAPSGLRLGGPLETASADSLAAADTPQGLRLGGPAETVVSDTLVLDKPSALALGGLQEALDILTVVLDAPTGLVLGGVPSTLSGAISAQRVDITVSIGPPRVGSVAIGEPRVGSVDIAPARSGSVTIDSPRTGSVEIDEARIERGP